MFDFWRRALFFPLALLLLSLLLWAIAGALSAALLFAVLLLAHLLLYLRQLGTLNHWLADSEQRERCRKHAPYQQCRQRT